MRPTSTRFKGQQSPNGYCARYIAFDIHKRKIDTKFHKMRLTPPPPQICRAECPHSSQSEEYVTTASKLTHPSRLWDPLPAHMLLTAGETPLPSCPKQKTGSSIPSLCPDNRNITFLLWLGAGRRRAGSLSTSNRVFLIQNTPHAAQ